MLAIPAGTGKGLLHRKLTPVTLCRRIAPGRTRHADGTSTCASRRSGTGTHHHHRRESYEHKPHTSGEGIAARRRFHRPHARAQRQRARPGHGLRRRRHRRRRPHAGQRQYARTDAHRDRRLQRHRRSGAELHRALQLRQHHRRLRAVAEIAERRRDQGQERHHHPRRQRIVRELRDLHRRQFAEHHRPQHDHRPAAGRRRRRYDHRRRPRQRPHPVADLDRSQHDLRIAHAVLRGRRRQLRRRHRHQARRQPHHRVLQPRLQLSESRLERPQRQRDRTQRSAYHLLPQPLRERAVAAAAAALRPEPHGEQLLRQGLDLGHQRAHGRRLADRSQLLRERRQPGNLARQFADRLLGPAQQLRRPGHHLELRQQRHGQRHQLADHPRLPRSPALQHGDRTGDAGEVPGIRHRRRRHQPRHHCPAVRFERRRSFHSPQRQKQQQRHRPDLDCREPERLVAGDLSRYRCRPQRAGTPRVRGREYPELQ